MGTRLNRMIAIVGLMVVFLLDVSALAERASVNTKEFDPGTLAGTDSSSDSKPGMKMDSNSNSKPATDVDLESSAGIGPIVQVSPSPYVDEQDWNLSGQTHYFVVANGRRFTLPNPLMRVDLHREVETFRQLSPEVQKEFWRRRQVTLVQFARLMSAGKGILPAKMVQSALLFLDTRLMESSPVVVSANDFGLSFTQGVSVGVIIPAQLSGKSKLAQRAVGPRGGFLKGAALGINIGFLPEAYEAYVELVGDYENLHEGMMPAVAFNHNWSGHFYARLSDGTDASAFEHGKKLSMPVPAATGINTDQGFYLGATFGVPMIPFLPSLLKDKIIPFINSVSTYTTNFHRVHLVRAVVGRPDQQAITFEFPVLSHPALASTKQWGYVLGTAAARATEKFGKIQSRLYELWPDSPSCLVTLGL